MRKTAIAEGGNTLRPGAGFRWKTMSVLGAGLDIERAFFVSRAEKLNRCDQGTWSRLYFGTEFCERLIADPGELEEVISFSHDRDLPLTLVTPYTTGTGLNKITSQLELLLEKADGSEVVFNDWGTFRLLTNTFTGLQPVLGRLLTKQKRGPRLMDIASRVPSSLMEHFRHGTFEVSRTAAFLQKAGIKRIELDNLLQGVRHESPFSASLHVPFVYISTTRICLTAGCDWENRPHQRAVFPCGHECRKYTFKLEHKDMPVPVILRGNTQFYWNEKLPGDLGKIGVDRIVISPEPPVA